MPFTAGELSSLLSKIDERTTNIQSDITELKADLRTSVKDLTDAIKESEEKQDRKIIEVKTAYVERVEFEPIKRFVYGIVMFVFITVVGGGMALLFQSKNTVVSPAHATTEQHAVEMVVPVVPTHPTH